MYSSWIWGALVLAVGLLSAKECVNAQTDTTTITPSTTPTTTPSSTTTPTLEEDCKRRKDNCSFCLDNVKCLWCSSLPPDRRCIVYPASSVIPSKDVCPLSDARWGTCTVNYEVLLIAMGVVAGILLLALAVCICCCCCRRRRSLSIRASREEAAVNAEYEERRTRNSERRAERQAKYDAIRAKYGLGGDGGNSSAPYTRFEDEA